MSERWRPKQIRREIERRRTGDTSNATVFGRYEAVPDGNGGTVAPSEQPHASTTALRCRHERPWRECVECSKRRTYR